MVNIHNVGSHDELRVFKSLRIFAVSQHPAVELMLIKCRPLNGTSEMLDLAFFVNSSKIFALELNIPVHSVHVMWSENVMRFDNYFSSSSCFFTSNVINSRRISRT